MTNKLNSLSDLKDCLNSLSEEQLANPIYLWTENEKVIIDEVLFLQEPYVITQEEARLVCAHQQSDTEESSDITLSANSVVFFGVAA